MNDPADTALEAFTVPNEFAQSVMGQVEDIIRRHPLAATFAVIAVGCAVGLAARGLVAPPSRTPEERALQILEDIQDSLAKLAEPAGERLQHLADEGASATKRGLRAVAESKVGGRLREWFS